MPNLLQWIFQYVSPLELAAAVTGLVCVWLLVRNNIWNWWWGVVSAALYGIVFWQFKLYSNMGLQLLYFLPMQFYGWWMWKKGGPSQDNDLPVTRLAPAGWIGSLAACGVFTAGWGYLMASQTNAALPYWDAAVTGLSIVAQYLQARKRYENWHFWIAVDLISAFYLFPMQKLYVTTGLYVVFLVLAFMGAVEWRRIMTKQEAAVADGPTLDMPLPPTAA